MYDVVKADMGTEVVTSDQLNLIDNQSSYEPQAKKNSRRILGLLILIILFILIFAIMMISGLSRIGTLETTVEDIKLKSNYGKTSASKQTGKDKSTSTSTTSPSSRRSSTPGTGPSPDIKTLKNRISQLENSVNKIKVEQRNESFVIQNLLELALQRSETKSNLSVQLLALKHSILEKSLTANLTKLDLKHGLKSAKLAKDLKDLKAWVNSVPIKLPNDIQVKFGMRYTAWGQSVYDSRSRRLSIRRPRMLQVKLGGKYNSVWGYFCSDMWKRGSMSSGIITDPNVNTTGNVVCQMLGYHYIESVRFIRFVTGPQNFVLSNVTCMTGAKSLSDCFAPNPAAMNCKDYQLKVNVTCANVPPPPPKIPEGKMRLVGSKSELSGKLQVFYNRTWRYICHHNISAQLIGIVACSNLISSRPLMQKSVTFTTDSSGSPAMFGAICKTTHRTLLDCAFLGWHKTGVSGCRSVVTVECGNESATQSPPEPQTLRLTGDQRKDTNEGYLEIYHQNTWGTICDDMMETGNQASINGTRNGQLACKLMGYSGVKELIVSNVKQRFGQPLARMIWLDDMVCLGHEENLGSCSHRTWGSHDCTLQESVGIICTNDTSQTVTPPIGPPTTISNSSRMTTPASTTPKPNLQFRLVNDAENSVQASKGRLEVFWGGSWGTVCDDNWEYPNKSTTASGRKAGHFICKSLSYGNFTTVKEVFTDREFPGDRSQKIWLDNVSCHQANRATGTFSDCTYAKPLGTHDCGHDEDVGLECVDYSKNGTDSSGGDRRLTTITHSVSRTTSATPPGTSFGTPTQPSSSG